MGFIMSKKEFSDSPVRIEIKFDPELFKTNPEKCILYKFFFKDHTNMDNIDIKELETLEICTSSVNRVIRGYIDSYYTHKAKVAKEINDLTD